MTPKTLKSKVSLVYFSLICIILMLGVISLWNLTRIGRAVNNIVITNYNSIQRLGHMSDALNSQSSILLTYLDTGNYDAALEQFDAQTTIFWENYHMEHATIIIPYEMELIEGIGSEYESFLTQAQAVFSAEGNADALTLYQTGTAPQAQRVTLNMDALVASNENALFARKEEAQQTVSRAWAVLAVFFLLAAVIGFFALKLYTDKLFRPIYEITQNLKAVRQGNLNRKSSVRSNDELGALCEEFNNMTQRLLEFERSTMGQLLSERNRTMAIVRSITEPLVILDGNQRVTLLNHSAEELFGLFTSDSAGQDFLSVIRRSRFHEPLSQILRDPGAYQEEVLCIGSSDDARYFNVTLTPLHYEGIDPGSVILVFYDITELKRLDTMRSDFIATISHEFKTPLTSIVFGADLLSDGSLGALNPAQGEVVTTLKEDGERLSRLVSDLLLLSRIESPNLIYQFVPCDLAGIIRSALPQFLPLAEQGGVSLAAQPEADLPLVLADPDKIKWVLNNLLSNAVKYTDPGGRILVRARLTGASVTCEVSDTGEGIPPAFLERIFTSRSAATIWSCGAAGWVWLWPNPSSWPTTEGSGARASCTRAPASILPFRCPIREFCTHEEGPDRRRRKKHPHAAHQMPGAGGIPGQDRHQRQGRPRALFLRAL